MYIPATAGFVEAFGNNLGQGGTLLHREFLCGDLWSSADVDHAHPPFLLPFLSLKFSFLPSLLSPHFLPPNLPPLSISSSLPLSLSHDVADGGVPVNYWFNLLYGSGVLLFCLLVCLIGASECE